AADAGGERHSGGGFGLFEEFADVHDLGGLHAVEAHDVAFEDFFAHGDGAEGGDGEVVEELDGLALFHLDHHPFVHGRGDAEAAKHEVVGEGEGFDGAVGVDIDGNHVADD